ncbi:hypothetical protein SCP_0306190 [Sparassis crispa]|uniref:Uncharacterized protein n=1 Tax=Sparassis crispa TaxID=139825 RepID=A0A401GFD6_9APHY|nr:hypothetical protein SCP_0306190 [Sparassis crispa]GBE80898.1 hypothetical protein SCP_0306190 [Sparassis crispa]
MQKIRWYVHNTIPHELGHTSSNDGPCPGRRASIRTNRTPSGFRQEPPPGPREHNEKSQELSAETILSSPLDDPVDPTSASKAHQISRSAQTAAPEKRGGPPPRAFSAQRKYVVTPRRTGPQAAAAEPLPARAESGVMTCLSIVPTTNSVKKAPSSRVGATTGEPGTACWWYIYNAPRTGLRASSARSGV